MSIEQQLEELLKSGKKRIYISGKITGTTDYMERFKKVEEALTKKGFQVWNPAKVNAMLPKETDYNSYMHMCFAMIELCDIIYMMKGWEDSEGANLELELAKNMYLNVVEEIFSSNFSKSDMRDGFICHLSNCIVGVWFNGEVKTNLDSFTDYDDNLICKDHNYANIAKVLDCYGVVMWEREGKIVWQKKKQ